MKPCIRKTIIVVLIIIVATLVCTMIGVLVCLGVRTYSWGIRPNQSQWELWYYIFSIIGSTGTFAAVVLALFKEEILQKLNSPELVIKPFESFSLNSRKNPQGQILYYEYFLRIENKGPKQATGLVVSYSDLKYDIKRLRKVFDTVDIEGAGSLNKETVILPGETLNVLLFKVSNPNKEKSPEGNNVDASIVFSNVQIEEKATYSALFQVQYRIRANDSKEQYVTCEVNWSGHWEDDNEKMQQNIIVKKVSL